MLFRSEHERGEVCEAAIAERERPVVKAQSRPRRRAAVQHPVRRVVRPLRRGEVELLVRPHPRQRKAACVVVGG